MNGIFDPGGSRYAIENLETSGHNGSSIYFDQLAGPFSKLGLSTPSIVDYDHMHLNSDMSFIQPFEMYLDATIEFDISINNAPETT